MTSPPSLAAEAVAEPAGRGDVERRGLLVVEGAQALQRAAAGVAERDVAETTSSIRAFSRTSAMSSSRIRPATRGVYARRPRRTAAVAVLG